MSPKTLGELKSSPFGAPGLRGRSVKDEMRQNLLARLRGGVPIFQGVLGYEESVVPHVVNAVLARHNFILLGLRGQAKSRILRQLGEFLDDEIAVIEGCEINDNPFAPVCVRCRELIAEHGDDVAVTFRTRDERYVEKLATPDVTIADMIGDIDPIKAAKGGHAIGSDKAVHYGLIPRANRGIFAINELPDLAGKIQVGLFNIMQEGDVQIKGYPLRLPLDVALVFSANPEDYTARGKIVTPLKDRIGSEILTHYPTELSAGMEITEQEAWTERDDVPIEVPAYVREVVEEIAFKARDDQRVDKRSGVSQRLPISCLENVTSNAERRAVAVGDAEAVARIADVFGALPAITGKLELEYEGELKGPAVVARDLIRQALQAVFRRRFARADLKKIVEWFESGGTLKISDLETANATLDALEEVPGLIHQVSLLGVESGARAAAKVSAAEFILEGLCAVDRITRNAERGYRASGRTGDEPSQPSGETMDDLYRDYGVDPRQFRKKNLN